MTTLRWLLTFLLTLLTIHALSESGYAQANIVLFNNDAPNVGFNDPTTVAPIGGNAGTTLGQQRINAFNFAASIWAQTLTSGPTIVVRASWGQFSTCTTTSGTLASAGAVWTRREFSGGLPGTWYSGALANALNGSDLDTTRPEINITFNINLGTTDCLQNLNWYYGLNTEHITGRVNVVTVALHELSHGLGFQTFTNRMSGAQPEGFPSIYDRFLLDITTGKTWPQMTDAERVASTINTGGLVWDGPNVKSNVPSVLAAGTPSLRINGPPAIAGNYSVGTAVFGPALTTTGVTGTVIQALDGTGLSTFDACEPLTNSISGAIALVDRGNCDFVGKVKNAQNAGALAVIVVNNLAGVPPLMGGIDPTIVIPSVSITGDDGNAIKAQLAGGVNATVLLDLSRFAGSDLMGRPLMYTPSELAGGSSVSHWDHSATPNQLMEPNINSNLTHNVIAPHDLTFSLFRDIGWLGTSTITPLMQLSASNYSVNEGAGSVTVTVSANGPIANGAVTYATSDTAGLSNCNVVQGKASSRCDYVQSVGTLHFNGESQKTISIPIVDDTYAEGDEEFTITLSNPTGASFGPFTTATIKIIDNDSGTNSQNPVDDTPFFVRQHYIDFLGRDPDPPGSAAWQAVLNGCQPGDTSCDRVQVSSAFFRSPEFEERGYFVYRFYEVALGRKPDFAEFMPDIASVSGFLSEAEKEAQKVAFVQEFMSRQAFVDKYNHLGNTAYVDELLTTAGLPAHPGRQGWIDALGNATKTRAQVLRELAESTEVSQRFFNRAFVVMQYFGYLRRDPDALFLDWIAILDTTGDFRVMVGGFMNSPEYRFRFGP